MKTTFLLALACATAISAPALAVTTVSYAGGSGTTAAGTTVFQNFDGQAAGTSLGTNALVFANSVDFQAARPAFGSTANFGAVQANGTYSVNFGPSDAFSFVLGSLDTYNSLTLVYEGGATQTYAGGQIVNDLSFPSGNQISGETNGVVTYRVTSGPRLVGATFTSSSNSFEFDNLALAAVPEPATWAMMIGGFGLIGAASRRRATAKVVLA
jgi:hypothetical protein